MKDRKQGEQVANSRHPAGRAKMGKLGAAERSKEQTLLRRSPCSEGERKPKTEPNCSWQCDCFQEGNTQVIWGQVQGTQPAARREGSCSECPPALPALRLLNTSLELAPLPGHLRNLGAFFQTPATWLGPRGRSQCWGRGRSRCEHPGSAGLLPRSPESFREFVIHCRPPPTSRPPLP